MRFSISMKVADDMDIKLESSEHDSLPAGITELGNAVLEVSQDEVEQLLRNVLSKPGKTS